MTSSLNYSLTQSQQWERLICVKDRRTHNVMVPLKAIATVLYTVGNTSTEYVIPSEILSSGEIHLYMTDVQAAAIPVGSWSFDVIAYIRNFWQPVASGTITVSSLNIISNIPS